MSTMESLSAWYRLVIFLFALCTPAIAQSARGEASPFDVDRLVRGPDREDIPWLVWVETYPQWMPEQRHRVNVTAWLLKHMSTDEAIKHKLFFVIKVATADGRWASGGFITQISNPSDFGGSLYLNPGNYTIALIFYDAMDKRANVLRKRINVPNLKKEAPRPESDRDLPKIEFISEPLSNFIRPLDFEHIWLPVKNSRPLCIDIVANMSGLVFVPRFHYFDRRRDMQYNHLCSTTLEIAGVLSQLRLRQGRVRMSILDVLQMHTFLDREDAGSFNWLSMAESIVNLDRDTIDAGLIGSHTPSSYLVDRLNEILEDKACTPGEKSPFKIIIIVSIGLRLPKDAGDRQVILQNPESTRSFHFYIERSDFDTFLDDLPSVLRWIKPKQITITNPDSFHKALAALISGLEEMK